jgi:small subunit ribosomal protein S27e
MVGIKEPSSKFLKITCPNCSNEQVIFGKVSSKVKCLSCKKMIAKPSGGKTIVMAKVKEVL